MDWKEFFKPTLAKFFLLLLIILLLPLPYFRTYHPQVMFPSEPISYPVPNFVSFLSIILNGYDIGSMTPLGIYYISFFKYFTTEYWSWISLLINLLISYIAACFIIKIYHRFKNK